MHVIFIALMAVLLSPAALMAGSGVDISGYVKNLYSSSSLNTPFGDSTEHTLESIVRFRGFVTFSAGAKAEIAYEITPSVTSTAGVPIPFEANTRKSYRAFDLENILYDGHTVLYQNLDRAYLALSPGYGDIYIGRQAISFGSARAINPTDVLTAFTYNTIFKDERTGVDAFRFTSPRGSMGELDGAIVFGRDMDSAESAAFVRQRSYIMGTDVTLIAISFSRSNLLGLDIARSIGGAGTWLEAAHTWGQDKDYTRLSTGADYSLADGLYGYIEYHYNGPGKTDESKYASLSALDAYQDGTLYLLGRHYLAPGISYEASALVAISLNLLYNVSDGSVLLAPAIELNPSPDVYTQLGLYKGVEDHSGTEFGSYPDTIYCALNFYF